MHHQRFDRFARQIAAAGDRRSFIRAVVAAAIAVAGSRQGARGQEACSGGCPEDQVCLSGACSPGCVNHRDCRSKHDDPCISNNCIDGLCVSAIVDCLPGYECCQGECCAKGCSLDIDCAVLEPCRWGRCGLNGQCEFTELDPCIVCASNDECVGNGQNTFCCDGACRRPCPDGTIMGKGCECRAGESVTLDGLVVRDDASGLDGD